MFHPLSRFAAPLLAFALLSGAAQAFPGTVDLPNLTFPDNDVTLSTKACQIKATTACPTQG